jgi:hypothetical protein
VKYQFLCIQDFQHTLRQRLCFLYGLLWWDVASRQRSIVQIERSLEITFKKILTSTDFPTPPEPKTTVAFTISSGELARFGCDL